MFVYYLTFRCILSLPSFPVYDAKFSIKHQRICRIRVKIALYVSRMIGANRSLWVCALWNQKSFVFYRTLPKRFSGQTRNRILPTICS